MARRWKDQSQRACLRRRAQQAGCEALDDAELLALLISAALPRADVLATARRLLDEAGGLGGALADPAVARRLCGPSAALQLAAARAAAVRLARADVSGRPVIASSAALHAYVRAELAQLPREQFRVLFLDHRNRLIRDEVMGEGTVDAAPVYPREVLRRALELDAAAIVLAHNHPGGDPAPSAADVDSTRQIAEAGRALRIAVHDHFLVADQTVVSFKALGLL